jgi:hypothetical protein
MREEICEQVTRHLSEIGTFLANRPLRTCQRSSAFMPLLRRALLTVNGHPRASDYKKIYDIGRL